MSENTLQLALPPDAAFSCERCHRCCRGEWIIGITEEEAARLRALYPGAEPVAAVETLQGRPLLAMARSSGGACIYLDPDGCRVHREHGADAKPLVCRKFPFFFRAHGDTAWLHLSRMCPAVYHGRGARGEALAREIRAARCLSDTPAPLAPVRLAGNMAIDWPEYLALEEALVRLILDERWPLDDALAAAHLLLGRRIAGRPLPALETGLPPEEDPAMELVLAAIAGRQAIIGLHRYVIAAIVTAIESRRGVTGRVREGDAARGRPNRLAIWGEDMRRYFQVLLRRGRVRLAGLPASVPLRRVALIPWPRRRHPDLTPVRSFLASHLRHKLLLRAPDVEFGWHLFLGAYAIVKFYARAGAAAEERETLTPRDLQRGVEVAEYNLLLHRPLQCSPLDRRLVRGWFRRFLFHPGYPGSMIQP